MSNLIGVQWQAGDVILGLYKVTSILGQDASGETYRVRHLGWDLDLTVKNLTPATLAAAGGSDAYSRQIDAWMGLGLHPHIASCYYARPLNGNLLVFSEYGAGGSLQDWIRDRRLYREGPLITLRRLLDFAIQLAWGLQGAQAQGVIHPAVQSENTLLSHAGQGGLLKLTNFGWVNTAAASASDLRAWGLVVLEMFAGGCTWTQPVTDPAIANQALEKYLTANLVAASSPELPVMPLSVIELLQQCFQPTPTLSLANLVQPLQQIYQQVTGTTYLRREPELANYAVDSRNNQAVALIDLGQQDAALRQWEQALAIQPHHLESTYNRGLVLWRAGKQDDLTVKQQLTSRASSNSESDWKATYLLSLVELERSDPEAALQQLENIQTAVQSTEVESALTLARAAMQTTQTSTSIQLGGRIAQAGRMPHTITAAALSPDSRYAMSGGEDRTIRLWDLTTGRCLCTFSGHLGRVSAVAFNRIGSYILSASWDKTLKLWGLATTSYIRNFKGHRGVIEAALFSPDGYSILSGSQDRTVRLWDVRTGKCLRVYRGQGATISALAFSPDGRSFLAAGEGSLKQWDLSSGRITRIFREAQGEVQAVAYSPNGRYVVAAGSGITLWDALREQTVGTFAEQAQGLQGQQYGQQYQGQYQSVAFSPDGRHFVSGSKDGRVKLWEIASGRCLRTFEGHHAEVRTVAFDAEGRCLLTADSEGLRLWRLDTLASGYLAPLRLAQIQPLETLVSSTVFYEQELAQAQAAQTRGDALVAAHHLRKVRAIPGYSRDAVALHLWQMLYTRLPRQGLLGCWENATFARHQGAVQSACFSPDSHYVLSASADASLKLWDVTTGRCLRSLEGHQKTVTTIAYSHDRYALSGSADQTLKLWDVATGACLRTFTHTQANLAQAVQAVAISPDGNYALSGGDDGILKLWEIASGRCLRSREAHSDTIHAIRFTAEGRYVLTASADASLKLWDVSTGACLRSFTGHAAAVYSVAFNPDDRFILSGSADHSLKLWDGNTGECIRTWTGHTASVRSVAFSSDGQMIVSGSDDNTLKLWNAALGVGSAPASDMGGEARTLTGHQAAVYSALFSPTSSHVVSASQDGTCKLWTMDWELLDRLPAIWDETAKPYLDAFLRLHTPPTAQLPSTRPPTDEELISALMRRGIPTWTEADFQTLLRTLNNAGYGWLQEQGVRQRLFSLMETTAAPRPAAPEPAATAFATAFTTAFAPPASNSHSVAPRVVLTITEGSLKGQVFEFTERTTWIIGRANDCNLQLPNDKQHETISRYHCQLDINPPSLLIRDLGSLHGTYVNGQMIGRRQPSQSTDSAQPMLSPSQLGHALTTGDEIQLGKTVFRVLIEPGTVPVVDRTVMGNG